MLTISQRDFIILPTNWLTLSVNSVMGSSVLENMLNIPSVTALDVTDFKGMVSGHIVAKQTNVNNHRYPPFVLGKIPTKSKATFSIGSLQVSLGIMGAFFLLTCCSADSCHRISSVLQHLLKAMAM